MQDEFANIGLVTVTLLDKIVAADAKSLSCVRGVRVWHVYGIASTYVAGSIRIGDSNEVSVLPLEYHQTRNRILYIGVAGVEELDEDEWVNGSTP
jgi:hypothetical protein